MPSAPQTALRTYSIAFPGDDPSALLSHLDNYSGRLSSSVTIIVEDSVLSDALISLTYLSSTGRLHRYLRVRGFTRVATVPVAGPRSSQAAGDPHADPYPRC